MVVLIRAVGLDSGTDENAQRSGLSDGRKGQEKGGESESEATHKA